MDFHETGFGHTFFRGQLPALIHALKDIGTNLGKWSNCSPLPHPWAEEILLLLDPSMGLLTRVRF